MAKNNLGQIYKVVNISIRDLLRKIVSEFNQSDIVFGHGFEDALSEGWALISFSLSLPIDKQDFFLDCKLTSAEIKKINQLTQKRINEKIPLAYITGEAWLCGYRFLVSTKTIVPRSLIAEPLQNRFSPWLGDDFQCNNILELCCGGGSLLIIAAHAFGEADVTGVDLDQNAIELAQKNIAEYQLQNRIFVLQGDLFTALPQKNKQKFDLIISNPPYVKSCILKQLPNEYLAEPNLALDGGEDGLIIVHSILQQAKNYLTKQGFLILEIGGNAKDFWLAYPELSPIFINNSANDDSVLILSYKDICKIKNKQER